MQIAPDFTAEEWKALDLDSDNKNDWETAIRVFSSRIHARYIDPVDVLLKFEDHMEANKRRFGFTVLAIDLLLMETLQAFKEGQLDTKGKSKQVFKNFLKDSPHFSEYFPDDDSREKFYSEFRCGILHQGEVQGRTLVWSIGELYEKDDDYEIVNRNEVHAKLKQDIEDYITAVENTENKKLRKNFQIKMDAIANR